MLYEEDLDRHPERWVWCLHCERAFQAKDVRRFRCEDLVGAKEARFLGLKGEPYYMCAYEDCDGTPLDFDWWDEMLEGKRWSVRFADYGYPKVPERGKRYPLYGPGY